MTWSTGEIGALAMRAARGAGLPWGVAEEAAWAVRWLVRAGLPGPEALAAVLEGRDAASLLRGISLAERGAPPEELRPDTTLLDLAFIARTAPPGEAFLYADRDVRVRVWATGCDAPPAGGDLRLSGTVACPDRRPSDRAEMSEWTHRVLGSLAARTYAPASEASRITGAGAGLTDND